MILDFFGWKRGMARGHQHTTYTQTCRLQRSKSVKIIAVKRSNSNSQPGQYLVFWKENLVALYLLFHGKIVFLLFIFVEMSKKKVWIEWFFNTTQILFSNHYLFLCVSPKNINLNETFEISLLRRLQTQTLHHWSSTNRQNPPIQQNRRTFSKHRFFLLLLILRVIIALSRWYAGYNRLIPF